VKRAVKKRAAAEDCGNRDLVVKWRANLKEKPTRKESRRVVHD
jgi:hypothetical protein